MDSNHSYYQASRNLNFDFTSLNSHIEADLCIIGGGITGLSTAIYAREMGLEVVLIEAKNIGFGASGRSGGQMIIGYNQSYGYLSKNIGKENAQKLWKFAEDSIHQTRAIIDKYQIDCDLTKGYYQVGIKDRHKRELEEFLEDLQSAGYSHCQYLNKEQIQQKVISDKYCAGFYDDNSGHLHPLNYTLGLAKAAKQLGVKIYENTAAIDIQKGKQVQIKTPNGLIKSKFLAICGNAYLNGLVPKIENKIMPVGTYIIATEKMSEQEHQAVIADNSAVCDMNFVLNYFRFSKDNRLLFGGRVNYSGLEISNVREKLIHTMNYFFPQLAQKKVEYTWGGNVAITINRLPHIGKLSENIYFAQGFSGHGIVLTGITGQLIAKAIGLQDSGVDVFNKIKHQSFPGGKHLRTPLLVLSMAYFKMRDLI